MKVAVTGASGHLGNVLCRQLLERGYEVNALYNSDFTPLEGLNVNSYQGSILDRNVLIEFMKNCDFLFHCAGKISINSSENELVLKTNIEGVRTVLEVAIESEIKKIIHVSSIHAVSELPLNSEMNEDRPYKKEEDFAYDFSKAKGEQIMLKAFRNEDIHGCVVRPSCIVGKYDFKPSEFGKALLDMKNGKIPLLPRGGYNFINVEDVSCAMINAIEQGVNGQAYFLTHQYYSIREIAKMVSDIGEDRVFKMGWWILLHIAPLVHHAYRFNPWIDMLFFSLLVW